MVMGHELTHGFDDQGRKFDAQGNLKEWWTEQDAKAYEQRGKCISDEYTGEVAELGRLTRKNNGDEESSEHYARVLDLNLVLLRAERETALSLRAAGRISDETLRQIERELDLRESELTLDAEAGA